MSLDSWSVATDYFEMGFMRKMYCKLANEIPAWARGTGNVPETRKQETHSIARRHCDVAIRADCRRRPFSRKELLPVTIKASCMFGKLGDIRKRGIAFTNFLPVLSRNLVT